MGARFAQNFCFSLAPIVEVVADYGPATPVQFCRTPADSLLHLERILKFLRHAS